MSGPAKVISGLLLIGFIFGVAATLLVQFINDNINVEITFQPDSSPFIKEHPYDTSPRENHR